VAYYDKHVDTLHAFKDNHLIDTWLLSTYKEYGAGGQAIFDYEIDDRNKFSLSASYRKTSHRGYDQNGGVGPFLPTDDYIFDYIDFGGEYTFKPVEPLAIVVGASYSIMEPKRGLTGQVPQTGSIMDGHNLFSYQIGFFYDINTEHQLFFTYARKNRTPSMQQMFSRDDNGQPNGLHLSPERADHFELGYRGHPLDWLKFSGSLFYSAYTDRITWSGSRSLVNLAKVNSHGLELELEATINDYLSGGFSFSYLDVKTKGVSRENSLVTGSPEYTSSAYLIISPIEGLSIIPQAYMRSSFYNEPDPDDPNVNGSGFAVVDLTAKYEFKEHYSVEVGVKNVFDKYYYNSMDSPLPGRNFFLGLNVKY
jgi:iron complex outermembrane receptor protein